MWLRWAELLPVGHPGIVGGCARSGAPLWRSITCKIQLVCSKDSDAPSRLLLAHFSRMAQSSSRTCWAPGLSALTHQAFAQGVEHRFFDLFQDQGMVVRQQNARPLPAAGARTRCCRNARCQPWYPLRNPALPHRGTDEICGQASAYGGVTCRVVGWWWQAQAKLKPVPPGLGERRAERDNQSPTD